MSLFCFRKSSRRAWTWRHLPQIGSWWTYVTRIKFFCSGNTDNLNTPLHLQLSDVLAGALILSLEHLISKFNRWVGWRTPYIWLPFVASCQVKSKSTCWSQSALCDFNLETKWEVERLGFFFLGGWLMSGISETPGGWSLWEETVRKKVEENKGSYLTFISAWGDYSLWVWPGHTFKRSLCPWQTVNLDLFWHFIHCGSYIYYRNTYKNDSWDQRKDRLLACDRSRE